MKNTNRILCQLSLVLFASNLFLAAAGCGNGNDVVKEDPAVTKARTDTMTQIRTFYDKSKGNYDALSEEDKKALNALTGGEAQSKEGFSHMFPDKGAGGTGGMPASGPGVK